MKVREKLMRNARWEKEVGRGDGGGEERRGVVVLVRTEEATVVGLQEKGGGRLEGAKVGKACSEDARIVGSWLRHGVECAWVWSLAKGWLGACWGAISSGVSYGLMAIGEDR